MSQNPFSTLLLSIAKRLNELVPEIRYIDQDLGQLEIDGRPSVSYPAVLIDFANWKYEDWGDNVQKGEGFAILRIAVDAWSNTNNLTSPLYQNKGLAYYNIEYKIFKALHGWKPEHDENATYDYLSRTNVDKEDREDNLRVRNMIFSCGYEDSGAQPISYSTSLPTPSFIEE